MPANANQSLLMWGHCVCCRTVVKHVRNPFALPGVLLLVPAGFYLVLLCMGSSLDSARDHGWVTKPAVSALHPTKPVQVQIRVDCLHTHGLAAELRASAPERGRIGHMYEPAKLLHRRTGIHALLLADHPESQSLA